MSGISDPTGLSKGDNGSSESLPGPEPLDPHPPVKVSNLYSTNLTVKLIREGHHRGRRPCRDYYSYHSVAQSPESVSQRFREA